MRLRERMASNENYQISSELSDPLTARKHFTSELFKEKKIGKLEKRLVSRDEVKNLIQLNIHSKFP